jgi:import inner membrane translocase subunit TIM50
MLSFPAMKAMCKLSDQPIRVFAFGSGTTAGYSFNPVAKKTSRIQTLYIQQRTLAQGITQTSPKPQSSIPMSDEDKEREEMRQKHRANQARAAKWGVVSLACMAGGLAAFAISEWGPPRIDPETGKQITDEYSKYGTVKQYTLRTVNAMKWYKKSIEEPSRDVLLPEPLKAPYLQPPYTITVEMKHILAHPEWNYRTGWRFKKRPFTDYFLQQCGPPNFELVVFTRETGMTAHPILDAIDSQGYVMYRLYRDSTTYVDGVNVKDLNRINRPLSRVIHIDTDADACKFNPDNCLVLKEWDGKDSDTMLMDLVNFIKAIEASGVDDVRETLHHYSKFDDPLKEFKERQRKLAEQEAYVSQSVAKKKSLVGSVLKH